MRACPRCGKYIGGYAAICDQCRAYDEYVARENERKQREKSEQQKAEQERIKNQNRPKHSGSSRSYEDTYGYGTSTSSSKGQRAFSIGVLLLKIAAVLFVIMFLFGPILSVYFDTLTLPFSRWKIQTFGTSAAVPIARDASDYYFTKYGKKTNYTREDIESIYTAAKQQKEYKAVIEEQYFDQLLKQNNVGASKYSMARKITVNHSAEVTTIDIQPQKFVYSDKVAFTTMLEKNFLPFGTYSIIKSNNVFYILADTGKVEKKEFLFWDYYSISGRTKKALPLQDNAALFAKLTPYLMQNNVNLTVFAPGKAECYELLDIKEYSIADGLSYGGANWRDKYLRVYKNLPASYRYSREESLSSVHKRNYSVNTAYFYTWIDKSKPNLSDYKEK